MADQLDKFCFRSGIGLVPCSQPGVCATDSLTAFFNELQRRFDNDVVEKAFYNSPRAVLRFSVKMRVCSGERRNPSLGKVAANQAKLAN